MAKSKLGTWLKKHLDSSSKSKTQSADRPPCPPSRRLGRPLTPAAPDEVQPQPPTCLLFEMLPAELRRKILITAFGDRTLHMDLVFDHPLPSAPSGHQKNHPGTHRQGGSSSPGSASKPKAWRWGGTVCHRNPPELPSSGMVLRFSWLGPWRDECMERNAGLSVHDSPWWEQSQIGIMGFLLSCRQAYLEGIDILYGANTITIASEPLMLQLPKVMVPQRLASITSLELVVGAHESVGDDGKQRLDLGHLAPILDHVAAHCRQNLRSLCLSLKGRYFPGSAHVLDGADSPLLAIDAFFLQMQLRDMRVEMPYNLFVGCNKRSSFVPAEHALERTEGRDGKRIWRSPWRCFDREDEQGRRTRQPEIQHRSVGNYPRPPLQLPTEENADKYAPSVGYWISEGEPDPTPRYVVCF